MDAEKYLEQIEKLDALIEECYDESKWWKEIATGTTAQMGGERVQSSGDKQRMASAMNRSADADARAKAYAKQREEIMDTIRRLPAKQYKILYNVYTKYMSLHAASIKCGVSYATGKKIRKEAIREVQRMLDEREQDGGNRIKV